MTTKKSKKLVVSLSKAVLGLSLVTYLYAGGIQDDLTSYIKKYEPELYEKVKDGEIEIDDSISSEHEEDMKTAHKIPRDDIIPISPREECEQNNGIFLENNYIATCVSENGTFGNGYRLLGMTFNPEGTGTVNSPDFLRPGIPWEFFSVKFNDKQYVNNNTGTYQIPTKISPLNRFSSYWIGEVSSNLKAKKRERPFRYTENGGVITYSTIKSDDKNELQIVQKYAVDPNSREIIVRVEMYNPGEVTLKDLYYARGLNPNQDGKNSIYYPYYTLNMKGGRFGGLSINSNNIVQGIGINSKLAVALYSVDPIKHNTCIGKTWVWPWIWGGPTDPQQIALNSSLSCNNIEYPIYSNSTINIGFSLGELKPKEKKVFSFKYLFEKRKVIPKKN